MTLGTPADWIAEGERRALREWQQTHREPCDDCTWVEEIETVAGLAADGFNSIKTICEG